MQRIHGQSAFHAQIGQHSHHSTEQLAGVLASGKVLGAAKQGRNRGTDKVVRTGGRFRVGGVLCYRAATLAQLAGVPSWQLMRGVACITHVAPHSAAY